MKSEMCHLVGTFPDPSSPPSHLSITSFSIKSSHSAVLRISYFVLLAQGAVDKMTHTRTLTAIINMGQGAATISQGTKQEQVV